MKFSIDIDTTKSISKKERLMQLEDAAVKLAKAYNEASREARKAKEELFNETI